MIGIIFTLLNVIQQLMFFISTTKYFRLHFKFKDSCKKKQLKEMDLGLQQLEVISEEKWCQVSLFWKLRCVQIHLKV